MAVAATVTSKSKRGGVLSAFITLVFSGNYVALGEPLDFNTIVGYTSRQPKNVIIAGKAGFVYLYDLANKKVMVFCNVAGGANLPLVEHTAIAYVAGVTGDVVTAEVSWAL